MDGIDSTYMVQTYTYEVKGDAYIIKFKVVHVYVVHLQDRLLSYQQQRAYAPTFPPGGEGMRLMKL